MSTTLEPVGEIEVEPLRRAAPDPLAVADHEVEGRAIVAEVGKTLVW